MTRAGFWQRLGALLVDCIVLTALVQLAAIVLYPLSDGKLQAHGLVRFIDCQPAAELPAGVVVPPEYDAPSVKACRVSLLGLEYGHYLEAERSKTAIPIPGCSGSTGVGPAPRCSPSTF